MKNHLIKALMLVALAPALLTGCAFQNLGTFDESESSSETSKDKTIAGVGKTISGDGYSITLNSARYSTADTFGVEPENGKYLILDVTIENSSEDENSISSLMSFTLQGSDAFEYDQSLTAKKKGSLDGDVKVGGKLRGEIAYDVPELEYFDFSFKNSIFSDSVSFQIKSNQIK